jgi:excisionase family DNA binding protein
MIPDHVMKVEDAAKLVGVSRPSLYRLAREYPRELKNFKFGRYRVFDKAAVERFARARKDLTQL